jgi:hypothetical protein
MTNVLLLGTALLSAQPDASALMPDNALLTIAVQSFAEGIALRNDAARARPAFARAAIAYDELWQRGCHNPALALNRANAHRLAGNLPATIVALHEGLAVAPWDRPLQVALESARGAVAYPASGDLAAQCRPVPDTNIARRMSPAEAWLVAGLLWLLVCGSLARFVMTRSRAWLAVAVPAAIALTTLGLAWLGTRRELEEENATPLVIVAEDVVLRRGNADSYPPRLEARIPRGVEARELTRRGGWAQVRLAGGAVGWLPESAILEAGVSGRRTTATP